MSRLCALILLLIGAGSTRALGDTFVIPWSPAPFADCAACQIVRDSDVAAAVPQISPDDKRLEFCLLSTTGPPQVAFLKYSPEVTGKHRVATKVLQCRSLIDRLECTFESEIAYFDSDPDIYFSVSDSVELPTALQISRLYSRQRFSSPEASWIKSLGGLSLHGIARRGSHFELSVGGCGCGGLVIVDLHRALDLRRTLQIIEAPHVTCV